MPLYILLSSTSPHPYSHLAHKYTTYYYSHIFVSGPVNQAFLLQTCAN